MCFSCFIFTTFYTSDVLVSMGVQDWRKIQVFGLFVYDCEQRFIKDLLSVILGNIRPSLVIWSLFPLFSSVSHSSPHKLFIIHGLSGFVSLDIFNMVDRAYKYIHIQGYVGMCGVDEGSVSLLVSVSVTEARLSPSKAKTSWKQLEITFLNVWGLYISYQGDWDRNGPNRSVKM